MDDLFSAAADVQAACERLRLRFCFIGGIAVIRWGTPRVTRDVDISVMADFGAEDLATAPLLSVFEARIPNAAAFARENRVLLLRTQSQIEIDVALAALPFEEEAITGASVFEPAPGVQLSTCSAEALIVMKAFASRPRDWSDIASIIARQKALDWSFVDRHLPMLAEAKDDPTILTQLHALRDNAP